MINSCKFEYSLYEIYKKLLEIYKNNAICQW